MAMHARRLRRKGPGGQVTRTYRGKSSEKPARQGNGERFPYYLNNRCGNWFQKNIMDWDQEGKFKQDIKTMNRNKGLWLT
jgi:hypothetical protein